MTPRKKTGCDVKKINKQKTWKKSPDVPLLLLECLVCETTNTFFFSQLEIESHRLTLDGETADLTHADQLEARLASVNRLLNHLSQVQERKDTILSQLQTRRPENSITIHAPYQM